MNIKCIRCQGKGYVRKYIMDGCSEYFLEFWDSITSTTLYFPMFLFASFIFGGIIGFFYFIILNNALPFKIFGEIFYFKGGVAFSFIISILLFDYKKLFGNKIKTIILLFIYVYFGYIGCKLGHNLFIKKGFFNLIINLIYSFIQGGIIGLSFTYLVLKKSMLDENNGKTKCPLCEGKNFIPKNLFNGMKKCQNCNINIGYENPKGISLFQKRTFCKNCKGIGYIK